MLPNIKLILTDLDGVIRHFPVDRDRKIELKYGMQQGYLAKAAFGEALLEQVITGKITDEAWRSKIIQNLMGDYPHADCFAAIHEWSAFHGQIDHDILSYLESLGSGISLGLLTNATSRLNADLASAGILGRFQHIFNSSTFGYAKPSTEAFLHVCNQLCLKPSEVIFIDDSERNIRAAKSIGMNSYLFTNLEVLQRSLEDFLRRE